MLVQCPRYKGVSGFTMIELLTVITIMSLLITLVGPVSINFIKKTQAQSEFIQLKNDLKKLSYLSFVSATIHQIDFSEQQALVIKNKQQSNVLKFQHLHFDPQQISFNSRGYPNPEYLTVNFVNKKEQINLFKLVEGVDAKISSKN